MTPHVIRIGGGAPTSPYWLHDTFTEESDTPLESHTPDVGPAAWDAFTENQEFTVFAADGGIKQDAGATTISTARYPTQVPQADAEATLVVNMGGHTTSGDRIGLWLRDTDGTWGAWNEATTTGYQFRLDASGGWRIAKFQAGTENTLASASEVISATEDIEMTFRAQGTTLTIYLDGVEIHSVTDADISSAGYLRLENTDLPDSIIKEVRVELL